MKRPLLANLHTPPSTTRATQASLPVANLSRAPLRITLKFQQRMPLIVQRCQPGPANILRMAQTSRHPMRTSSLVSIHHTRHPAPHRPTASTRLLNLETRHPTHITCRRSPQISNQTAANQLRGRIPCNLVSALTLVTCSLRAKISTWAPSTIKTTFPSP